MMTAGAFLSPYGVDSVSYPGLALVIVGPIIATVFIVKIDEWWRHRAAKD